MADEKVLDAPTELDLALRELEWSLEALTVQPLGEERPGRAPGGPLAAGDTTDGYTCNFKCGDTAYWECPPFTTGSTCTVSCDGPCSPTGDTLCQTTNATSPCACWGQSEDCSYTETLTNCTNATCDVNCT